MAKEPLPMHKIESVLRLHHIQNQSIRNIASSLGLKRSTVSDYLKRASKAGITWPLPENWDEQDLHSALFGGASISTKTRALPDWGYIHQELRKKGVTLQLLHQEYLHAFPEGYRYSQFCERYRRFRKTLNVSLRQTYRAGEKLFVDFAGQTIPITDPKTGKMHRAHLFVAVLGASNYTYAEAVTSESLQDWVAAHCRAFEYFGGVSELVIPDNTKCAVVKTCRYEPVLNPTYLDLAKHYGTCIIPTRAAHPKDKAKVEAGVLVVERWIIAALRSQTFFSLAELNRAIADLLERLNHRPFKKLPGCRYSLFTQQEKPALRPLPQTPFEYALWRKATVNIDYHVAVHLGEKRYHYYSVPYTLVRREVKVRLTGKTVEIYCAGKRVAGHRRNDTPGRHTTLSEHMPEAHKRYLEWTPGRILKWAARTGPACVTVAQTIMETKPHPEQGFRSCLGLIRLGKIYGNDRLEHACKRAIALNLTQYRSIKSMLATNRDKMPLPGDDNVVSPANAPTHVRGSDYYR